ncbi:arginase, partial [bacterium]
PLVLGGEHTVAVAGIGAALNRFRGDLGLLWIDAHADINTPETSTSGNIHGMPVAALQGLASGVEGVADDEWNVLLAALGEVRLGPENTGWIGLRDVDFGERAFVRRGLGLTMTDIDRYGMAACVDRLDEHFRQRGIRHLWISFDVDALDPFLAPGTGTAVRGGLTYREAHLMAELLREKIDSGPYDLVGLDVVETNPLVDTSNETARMAVEWVLSLFGKTIL